MLLKEEFEVNELELLKKTIENIQVANCRAHFADYLITAETKNNDVALKGVEALFFKAINDRIIDFILNLAWELEGKKKNPEENYKDLHRHGIEGVCDWYTEDITSHFKRAYSDAEFHPYLIAFLTKAYQVVERDLLETREKKLTRLKEEKCKTLEATCQRATQELEKAQRELKQLQEELANA